MVEKGQVTHESLSPNLRAVVDLLASEGAGLTVADDLLVNGTVTTDLGVLDTLITTLNTFMTSFTGVILPYGGDTAPTGWFLCDGSAISRTTYASLFAKIGTTFGIGNGSTTFNIPDLRGIFIRGAGTSGKLLNAFGNAFSGILGHYGNDGMQGHYHNNSFANDSTGELTGTRAYSADVANRVQGGVLEPTNDGTHGDPRVGYETKPANLGLNFIIKT
jgi:microcystin-dependent protein